MSTWQQIAHSNFLNKIYNYQMNNFITCMTKKFFKFSGRASKKEYWMFFLFMMICYAIAIALDMNFGLWDSEEAIGLFSGILILVFFIPHISLTARRFHDINKSGWFQLIFLIPFVGLIAWVMWMSTDAVNSKNRFGKPVKYK